MSIIKRLRTQDPRVPYYQQITVTAAMSPFTPSLREAVLNLDVSNNQDIVINLPTAVGNKGKVYFIRISPPKSATPPFGFGIINAFGVQTIDGNMIAGGSSITMTEPDKMQIIADGLIGEEGWNILSESIHSRAILESLSTGMVEIDDPSQLLTYVQINPGDNTRIDVLTGGKIRIVDWSNDDFRPIISYKKYDATIGIIANANNGNNVVTVDKNGNVIVIQPSNTAPELPTVGDVHNLNNAVQIGLAVSVAGVLAGAGPVPDTNANMYVRWATMLRILGRVNSLITPIQINPVGGNLQLEVTAGDVLSQRVGIQTNGSQSPDVFTTAFASPQVILLITRDNIIQSASITVDVINIESPIGTLTLINPNKFKNIYNKVFPASAAIGLFLGQIEYGTAQEAIEAATSGLEKPEFSSIAAGGVAINVITVKRDETDLSNGLTINLFRIE